MYTQTTAAVISLEMPRAERARRGSASSGKKSKSSGPGKRRHSAPLLGDDEVEAWLHSIRLGSRGYGELLHREGYDELALLHNMQPTEVLRLIEATGMKPKHAEVFKFQLAQLAVPASAPQVYRVVERGGAKVRAGFEMDSPAAGELRFGDTLESFEARVNNQGVTRVRFDRGWVSVTSGDGSILLEKAERVYSSGTAVPVATAIPVQPSQGAVPPAPEVMVLLQGQAPHPRGQPPERCVESWLCCL